MKIEHGSLVYIDTSAFIALIMPRDALHSQAVEIITELKDSECKLVTTEFVIVEFLNALSRTGLRQRAARLIDEWLPLSTFEVVWSSREIFDSAYRLFCSRPDKDWSLTDCAGILVIKTRKIEFAFTSDKHFEQAGFRKLLGH